MASAFKGAYCALWLSAICLADEPVVAPTVDVPIQLSPAPPVESAARRDLAAQTTVIDVTRSPGRVRDAAELISQAPGAVVSDRGGPGQSQSVSLRGAASNGVLVLLDGTPLSTAGGGADLSTVPLAILDHVEVVRGSGSRYGSGALGGVVNLVTRAPDAGRADGTVSAGAFDTQTLSLSGAHALLGGEALLVVHGFRTRGDFRYLYDATPAFEGDSKQWRTRENNQANNGGALLRLRRPALGFQTDVSAEVFALDRGLAGTAPNPTLTAHESTQRAMVTARATRSFEGGSTVSSRASVRTEQSDFKQLFASSGPQRWTVGEVEVVAEKLIGAHHALGSLASIGGESFAGAGAGAALGRARLSAMAWDDVLYGPLTLSPSVRVDQTGAFTGFSPKLGAVAALSSGFELRANAGQSHRAPSFLELYVPQGTLIPNPKLRPERALSADVQLCHSTSRTRIAIGAFYSLYEDLISYELYPPFLAKPFNFNTALAYGAEVEAFARPTKWLSFNGSYTLSTTRNLRDDARYYLKTLPYRPAHKAFARATAGAEALRFFGELAAQSAQFVNRTETLSLPGRAFVNLGAAMDLHRGPDVTLAFEVKNVLDEQAADLDGYPLPGRAAYVTLSLAIDGRQTQGASP